MLKNIYITIIPLRQLKPPIYLHNAHDAGVLSRQSSQVSLGFLNIISMVKLQMYWSSGRVFLQDANDENEDQTCVEFTS